jgi:hypothetical protein
MKKRKGFTLIAAVFIILVVTLFAMAVTNYVSSESHIAIKNYQSLNAFYIANAGLQSYLKELGQDDDWFNPPAPETSLFSGGKFLVDTSDEEETRLTLTVTGLYTSEGTTYKRMLRCTVARISGWEFADDYVLYWGGGGGGPTDIGNNVVIDGNIFANNDVDVGSGATISGDAYSTGDISGDTGGISGTAESDVATPEVNPEIDTTYYDNEIATAATYPPGDQDWTGTTTLSGTYYINGNGEFGNASVIDITGVSTIVATGTFLARNYSSIGDNLTVIADGLITIQNDVSIGANGIWYSSVGFDVGNTTTIGAVSIGSGTSFISPGDIDIGNNVDFSGLLFCEGTLTMGNNMVFEGNIIAGYVDSIGNESSLTLNPDLVDPDAIVGLKSGLGTDEATDIETWDEVY